MTRSFVAPSGIRRDPFTGERVRFDKKPKQRYEYDRLITNDDISKEFKFIRKICKDALKIEAEVRAGAFEDASFKSIDLEVFSLTYARRHLGLSADNDDLVSIYHEVHDRDKIDLRSIVQGLQRGVEQARGYKMGKKPLEAYQELLRHCGGIFIFLSALEISERSPGFFDPSCAQAEPR